MTVQLGPQREMGWERGRLGLGVYTPQTQIIRKKGALNKRGGPQKSQIVDFAFGVTMLFFPFL